MISSLLALALPLTAGPARAHDAVAGPPDLVLGNFEGWLGASLGIQWLARVGEEAEQTKLDPVLREGVRAVQGSLDLALRGPSWTLAHLRVEEGLVHAGGLEAAEAELGLREPEGGAWFIVGRGDLFVTWDRLREAEGLLFADRPGISRTLLPLHVNSVRAGAASERVGAVQAGLSWAAATSDAPYRWVRADVHPLGEPGLYQDSHVEGPRVRLGGTFLDLDSPTLGGRRLLGADGEVQLGHHTLGGGWQRWEESPLLGAATVRSGAQAFVGLQVLELGPHALRLDLQGERAAALVDGEEARLVGQARVAWQPLEAAFTGYVGARIQREQGSAVSPGEDVVDLGRGVERANDVVHLGFLARW